MNKKSILKNFPTPTKFGVCKNCVYIDICDKILPGFNKPNKCGGPFIKQTINKIITMITEDYCSAEVGKLLQEKGFNEPISELNRCLFEEGKKPILKITQQKAMRWLREVHNILVSPYALSLGYYFEIFDLTSRDITGCKPLYKVGIPNKEDVLNTYEEAVEAALKYSLENLI